MRRLLRKRLKWHYRSRREGLIAFSNHHFYRGELITFPSVEDTSKNPSNRSVILHYVKDGRWKPGSNGRGGFNANEAKRTAELIVEHFQKTPDESLGVIAFSQKQQERIRDELEQLRKKNPNLEVFFDENRENRPEPFFVKNLETVQGDERDVIFLAIGYGPIDDTGRVALRFGPLNQNLGERRLNVAVTRARKRMTVISSMKAQDIDQNNKNKTRGVQLLREYLDYAERGKEALPERTSGPAQQQFDSPFEKEVYDALVAKGLTVHTQVGCSDFRIDLAIVDPKAPGRYLLGVECDGARYHSSATARDRDRLRQEVLESLGWRICRIWSTDWFQNSDKQIERIMKELNTAPSQQGTSDRPPASRPPASPPPAVPKGETRQVPPASSNTKPPERVVPNYKSIDNVSIDDLCQAILNTLNYGATSVPDLIKSVIRQVGFNRTGNRIDEQIKKLINQLIDLGRLVRTEDNRVKIS
jgi:very-short-patch-repair endonuclease